MFLGSVEQPSEPLHLHLQHSHPPGDLSRLHSCPHHELLVRLSAPGASAGGIGKIAAANRAFWGAKFSRGRSDSLGSTRTTYISQVGRRGGRYESSTNLERLPELQEGLLELLLHVRLHGGHLLHGVGDALGLGQLARVSKLLQVALLLLRQLLPVRRRRETNGQWGRETRERKRELRCLLVEAEPRTRHRVFEACDEWHGVVFRQNRHPEKEVVLCQSRCSFFAGDADRRMGTGNNH